MRGGGGVQLKACVGAVCAGAASGCEGFDAIYEKEIMQPSDNVRVELCNDARCVESCLRYEFVRRVSAEGPKRGESSDGGRVRCTRAANDDGKDVDFGTWPLLADGIGEGVYLALIN
jgi:hypothetical protein